MLDFPRYVEVRCRTMSDSIKQKPSQRPGCWWTPGRIFTGGASNAGIGSPTTRTRLLYLLIRPMAPSLRVGIAVAGTLIVIETLVVCLLKLVSGMTCHFGTLYLLGVVVVSTLWGFGLSVTMSVASAIAFAYFRNWPADHFAPFEPQNWLVIPAFLVVALVANGLARLARMGGRSINLSSDLMCITGPDRVIRVNPAFTQILGYSLDDLVSRPFLDLIVPDDRGRVRVVLERLQGSATPARFESRVLCSDGSQRWIAWSVVWDRGLFYVVGHDVTEHRREQEKLRQAEAAATASRDKLGVLAEQQAALRLVATLVARGASPSEVFSAVADELAGVLHVVNAGLLRYEPDGTGFVVAVHYQPGISKMPGSGERIPLAGDDLGAKVLRTGRAARIDNHENARGPETARIGEAGIHSTVGVPIRVDGRLWGAAIVGSRGPEPMPADTEARVGDFADLVATAIANAATRSELIASRARIVAAADDARRRLERDLHDGAQQRLISLGLQLRMAEESAPPELDDFKQQLSRILSGLTGVSADLQEISRGIHPAILSKGGLSPALKTLARRSAVPVTLDLRIDRRIPDSAQVAAYYVVAEALTNTAKHARASEVNVGVETEGGSLRVLIRDDGVGGANSHNGSGLIGLQDRVEALGGHLHVTSPPQSGTSLHVTIPLDGD